MRGSGQNVLAAPQSQNWNCKEVFTFMDRNFLTIFQVNWRILTHLWFLKLTGFFNSYFESFYRFSFEVYLFFYCYILAVLNDFFDSRLYCCILTFNEFLVVVI